MMKSTDSEPIRGLEPRLHVRYGPWALVTGASDGIGRAMASQIAASGLGLVLVARREDRLEALAAELVERFGVETRVVPADLATTDGVLQVIEAVDDLDLGLFVASAGFGTSGPFVEGPIERELEQLRVNCAALLALTHAMARRFVSRGRGGIVLMSSLVGFQGVPRASHYAATKAYVQSLAEGLHVELAPLRVDVIASAPGPIHSGFAERANMEMGFALRPEDVARGTLRALGKKMTVRPGWLSKLLEALLTLPRALRVRIMTLVMAGMTKHQSLPATPSNERT